MADLKIDNKNWYTEEQVMGKVKDMEDLKEYLDGIDCVREKDGVRYYFKRHVDRYVNR